MPPTSDGVPKMERTLVAFRLLKRSHHVVVFLPRHLPTIRVGLGELSRVLVRPPNGSIVHLRASFTNHKRRGAAVATPNKRFGRSDLQRA
jgi:hypothetical protein